jgi:hypothetical protein
VSLRALIAIHQARDLTSTLIFYPAKAARLEKFSSLHLSHFDAFSCSSLPLMALSANGSCTEQRLSHAR